MSEELEKILNRVHGLADELEPYRAMLLANVVMISEIPAPTFGEQERISFLNQRFTESGLDSTSIDEMGNGVAILPGTEGKQQILLTAHADTPFGLSENHSCTLDTSKIHGLGVADNSLGLAVLATLPTLLDGWEFGLKMTLFSLVQRAVWNREINGDCAFFFPIQIERLRPLLPLKGRPSAGFITVPWPLWGE